MQKERIKQILQETYDDFVSVEEKTAEIDNIKYIDVLRKMGGMKAFFKNFDMSQEGQQVRDLIECSDNIEEMESMLKNWADFKPDGKLLKKAKKQHKISRILMFQLKKLNLASKRFRNVFIDVFIDKVKNEIN